MVFLCFFSHKSKFAAHERERSHTSLSTRGHFSANTSCNCRKLLSQPRFLNLGLVMEANLWFFYVFSQSKFAVHEREK